MSGLDPLVNASGFLFQLAVEDAVRRSQSKYQWRPLGHEVPYYDEVANEERFVDLVLTRRSGWLGRSPIHAQVSSGGVLRRQTRRRERLDDAARTVLVCNATSFVQTIEELKILTSGRDCPWFVPGHSSP